MCNPRISKAEFISGYCSRSGITEAFFYLHGDAVPCDCGESDCEGWAYLGHDLIRLERSRLLKRCEHD